jgi:hypothetical protein
MTLGLMALSLAEGFGGTVVRVVRDYNLQKAVFRLGPVMR